MRKILALLRWMAVSFLCCATFAFAQTDGIKLQWLGQSAFKITSPTGKVILIDPWLKANPLTPPQYKDLKNLGHIDVLLVTHGHWDHFADAPEIAKLNHTPMYAPGDMNATVVALGILPAELAPRMNKSGTVEPVKGIRVTEVHAEHSSTLVWHNPTTDKDETHVGGEPVGFIIELENGFKIYHMGDTGLFGDMRLIAQYYKPDVVLMPIGGNFTMGPQEAAYAERELLRIPNVIPMHYGANPLAKGKPDEFQALLKDAGLNLMVLKPGNVQEFAAPNAAQKAARVLAPTGELRVGVYLGSPTSMVVDAKTSETHGVAVDLGQALATSLQRPVRMVQFERVAQVIEAVKNSQVDMTFTNATAIRAKDVDFSPALIQLELGVLLPVNSSIKKWEEVNKAGFKLGVTQGSSSQSVLGGKMPLTHIVPVASLDVAQKMLTSGELDGFATNKGILFELNEHLSGFQVLDDHWGYEHLAIAIPKGRESGLSYLTEFAKTQVERGAVRDYAQRAGLRGMAP